MSGKSQLAATRQTMASTFGGKHEIEDQSISFWYKTDWVDLLTPAPTTVLILGRLMQLSIPVDFKLSKPDGGFKHIGYDYFGASVQQIANQGVNALVSSRSGMNTIATRSENVVKATQDALMLLIEGESDDIPTHLPHTLEAISKESQACLREAKLMQAKWQALLELTQELQEVSKSTRAETADDKRRAEDQKKLLETMAAQEKKNEELTKTMMDEAKDKYNKSEETLRESIKSMPGGWELGAMNIAQGLAKSAQTGLDAYLNQRLLKGNMIGLGQSFLSDKVGGGHENQPHGAPAGTPGGAPAQPPTGGQPGSQSNRTFSNPAYAVAASINSYYDVLKAVTTGSSGGVDWKAVDNSQDKSGVRAVRAFFEVHTTMSLGNGNPSVTAKGLIQKGIQYCDQLDEYKVGRPEDKVKLLIDNIRATANEAKEFEVEANLSLGSVPSSNDALLNPGSMNVSDDSSWSKAAVESAQFKIKSSQALFSSSKEMYKHSTDNYLETTRRLAEFQGQLDQIAKKEVNWEMVLEVLSRAIQFLAQLNQCLVKLVTYFDAVKVIVEDAADSKVKRLVQLIEDATLNVEYGSFKASNFVKQSIYDQTRAGVKVTRVVQKIARLYLQMYDSNIQGGVDILTKMGAVTPGENNKAMLASTGQDLQTWADQSTLALQLMMKEEAEQFEKYVDGRMKEIQQACTQILSIPNKDLDRVRITETKDKFIEDEKKDVAVNAVNKPDFLATKKLLEM